jgi:hypothetical protein
MKFLHEIRSAHLQKTDCGFTEFEMYVFVQNFAEEIVGYLM